MRPRSWCNDWFGAAEDRFHESIVGGRVIFPSSPMNLLGAIITSWYGGPVTALYNSHPIYSPGPKREYGTTACTRQLETR